MNKNDLKNMSKYAYIFDDRAYFLSHTCNFLFLSNKMSFFIFTRISFYPIMKLEVSYCKIDKSPFLRQQKKKKKSLDFFLTLRDSFNNDCRLNRLSDCKFSSKIITVSFYYYFNGRNEMLIFCCKSQKV